MNLRKGSFKSALLLFLVIGFMAAGEVCGRNGKTPASAQTSQRAKARYYYLEGVRCQVEQRNDEAYEYFRHAHHLDPDYEEASSAYGQLRFAVDVDTLQSKSELQRSFGLLRPFVDKYPGDFDESVYYAYVASRLDSLPEAVRVYERTDSIYPQRTATLLSLADVYFMDNQDEKAYEVLDRFERIEGKSPQLSLKKVRYMLHRLDTLAAVKEVSDLIVSNPREAGYYILKANLFKVMNRQDSVLSYLKKAEEIAPGFGAAKLELADYYREHGDSAAYDNKIYEALLAEDYGLEEKTGLLAEYLQALINDKSNTKRGDYLFSVLEKQYPHEPDVLDLAARYNAAKGNFKEAIERISYAIDLEQANPSFWAQKMTYQISDDKWKDALETYRESKKHIGNNTDIDAIAAQAAMIGEEYTTCVRIFDDIIKSLSPSMSAYKRVEPADIPKSLTLAGAEQLSNIYTTIGDCYYNSERRDSAFIAYDSALVLDPENRMALNNYAYFLVESGGDVEKAEEMSRRSLAEEDAENPTFLDTYAWILYKKGLYDEAITCQKKAIEALGDAADGSEELWDHYGDILRASGDRDGAVDAWKKALEISPDNKDLKNKIENAK